MIQRIVSMLLPVLLCSACVSYQGRPDNLVIPQARYDYRVVRDQTYTPDDWPQALQADIYVPDVRGLLSAVLVVHGGGWEEGRTRDDVNEIAIALARRGFVAVNIDYRYAPEYRFPAQLHDLQQAMHWIHDQADSYRIDTGRLAGFGYSAGAHLIALLATVSDGDSLDTPYGGPETRLDAVVAGGLPSDLRKFEGGTLVPQFLGATQTENFAIYKQASPIVHVTPDDPPMFLYHGGLDGLVPVDHAKDMYAALRAAGIDAELYIDHSRGHITMFLFDGGAIEKAIGFLNRQLSANERE